MPRKPAAGFSEKELSKGQARKLAALRNSIGPDIANRAFGEWLARFVATDGGADRNAEIIADTLSELANHDKLSIPRGGYVVRRGRGRVIVARGAGVEE